MGLGVTANRWIAAALACVPLLTGEAAAKGAEIKVSVEESAGAARVWIDAPGYYYSIRREGDRLMVWFTVPPVLATLPKPPRNVLAIEAVPGGIGLAAGRRGAKPPHRRAHRDRHRRPAETPGRGGKTRARAGAQAGPEAGG